MSFWGELKRRNVVRVGIAYLVAAWLIIQVANTFFPALQLPEWTVTFVAALLILGFPLSIALSWAYELTPDGLKKTEDVKPAESVTRSTGRKLDRVIIAVLALAVVFLVLDSYWLDRPAEPAESAPETAANAGAPIAPSASSAAAILRNSVAVLPFSNLSPNERDAYFAVGLHEEVLNQLSKLSNLSVISRTSVQRYVGSGLSIPEIARELKVTTVMEGNVRYAGDRIRVTVQLIEAATDQHLWSETYERPFDDIFAIESDIAMNVANALQAEFSPAEQEAIEQIPTTSPAAYALYLEATSILRQVGGSGVGALLDRALAIDPGFANAYGLKARLASISFVNTTQGTGVATEDRAALEREVRELTAKTFELDPENADARAALRDINIPMWHWTAFAEAVEPRDEAALIAASVWVYAWMGRREDAIRIGAKNAALNPNDSGAHFTAGIAYAYAGDRAASTRSLRRGEALAPALPLIQIWLADNDISLGNDERGLAGLRLVEQLLGENRQTVFLPELAYGYSRVGSPDDARRVFEEIRARANDVEVGAGAWAMAYLAVGDEPRALEQLEIVAAKARNHEPDQGYVNVMNLRMNYLADPTLEKPEFADVLERIRGD
jgi:TolB-like protein